MIINNYKAGNLRQACKWEFLFLTRCATHYLQNGLKHKNALFYPDYPDPRAAICRVIHALGYNIINNPAKDYDFAFYWQDVTVRDEPDAVLREAAKRVPVINLQCLDIGKVRVEEAFQEVFGYSSFVDPLSYRGKCVRKSNLNAQHDGKIIDAPIVGTEPGFIYQKLLSHIDPQDRVIDYRLAVYGSSTPYMTIRYKRKINRFNQTFLEVPVDPLDYLTAAEVSKCLKFCRELGMDYGEIDMIRDQSDGRLYLLDANNTPFRPPYDRQITPQQREDMCAKAATAFQKNFLQPAEAEGLPALLGRGKKLAVALPGGEQR